MTGPIASPIAGPIASPVARSIIGSNQAHHPRVDGPHPGP